MARNHLFTTYLFQLYLYLVLVLAASKRRRVTLSSLSSTFFSFSFSFFFEGFGSLRTIRIRLGRRVLRRDPPDNSVNDFAKMNKKKTFCWTDDDFHLRWERDSGIPFYLFIFFWVWWKGRKMIWIKRERHPEMFFFSCRSNSHSKVRSWPSENWIRRIRCNTGFIQIKGNALGRFYYGFSFWFRLHDSNVDGSNQNSFGVAPVQFLSVGLISKRPPESASIDRNGNQKENTHRFWREKLGKKKRQNSRGSDNCIFFYDSLKRNSNNNNNSKKKNGNFFKFFLI